MNSLKNSFIQEDDEVDQKSFKSNFLNLMSSN
jgi:hypothetical protein